MVNDHMNHSSLFVSGFDLEGSNAAANFFILGNPEFFFPDQDDSGVPCSGSMEVRKDHREVHILLQDRLPQTSTKQMKSALLPRKEMPMEPNEESLHAFSNPATTIFCRFANKP